MVKRIYRTRYRMRITEVTDRSQLGELDALLQKSFQNAMTEDNFEFASVNSYSASLNDILDQGGRVFAARYGRKLAGTVSMKPVEIQRWYWQGEVTCLKHLAVLPEYSHMGFGTMLVRKVCELAEGKPVWLGTPDKNVKALKFYKRNGFRKVAVFFSGNHYSVRLFNWNGSERPESVIRKEKLMTSALEALMWNRQSEAALRNKRIMAVYNRYFRPYMEGQPEEVCEDMIRCYRNLGASPEEYIRYGFETKNPNQRRQYITEKMLQQTLLLAERQQQVQQESTQQEMTRIVGTELRSRYQIYKLLKNRYHREAIHTQKRGRLRKFVKTYRHVMAVPVSYTSGKESFLITSGLLRKYDRLITRRKYKKIRKDRHLKPIDRWIRSGKHRRMQFYFEEVMRPLPVMGVFVAEYMAMVSVVLYKGFGSAVPVYALLKLKEGTSSFKPDSKGFDAYAMLDSESGEVVSEVFSNRMAKTGEMDEVISLELLHKSVPDWNGLMETAYAVSDALDVKAPISCNMILTEAGWAILSLSTDPCIGQLQTAGREGIRPYIESITDMSFTSDCSKQLNTANQ